MVDNKIRNEATWFGVKCTAPGRVEPSEARAWFEDLRKLVSNLGKRKFGLMVDIRGQVANPAETTEIITDAMKWLKNAGVERSAVIVDNAITRMQITRLAKSTGVYEWERYVDAAADPAWEKTATDWITAGIDPDR